MAAAAGEGVVDESRYIEEGALYLVEERLETFKESHWPFDSGPCTALKVRQGVMCFPTRGFIPLPPPQNN